MKLARFVVINLIKISSVWRKKNALATVVGLQTKTLMAGGGAAIISMGHLAMKFVANINFKQNFI